MSNVPDRRHDAVPTDRDVPDTASQSSPETLLEPLADIPMYDANGFDPRDYEWRPVPRRPRVDGWTPEVQQHFIQALARLGVVERACDEVNRSVRSAYDLRNAKGGEGFARAWDQALTRAASRMLDIAFEQAIEGEEIPVFDADGVRVGSKRRYNTRMAMFLLRAYHPERFRHANKDTRDASEPLPPPAVPIAEAVASLAPVTPEQPHLLNPPERMEQLHFNAECQRIVDENTAPGKPEGYRPPRIPPTHPKVLIKARRNGRKRTALEERDAERYDIDDDDSERIWDDWERQNAKRP